MSKHNMHADRRASQPLPCVHCRGVYSGAKDAAACAGGMWGCDEADASGKKARNISCL
jgi:hypothetical protein